MCSGLLSSRHVSLGRPLFCPQIFEACLDQLNELELTCCNWTWELNQLRNARASARAEFHVSGATLLYKCYPRPDGLPECGQYWNQAPDWCHSGFVWKQGTANSNGWIIISLSTWLWRGYDLSPGPSDTRSSGCRRTVSVSVRSCMGMDWAWPILVADLKGDVAWCCWWLGVHDLIWSNVQEMTSRGSSFAMACGCQFQVHALYISWLFK